MSLRSLALLFYALYSGFSWFYRLIVAKKTWTIGISHQITCKEPECWFWDWLSLIKLNFSFSLQLESLNNFLEQINSSCSQVAWWWAKSFTSKDCKTGLLVFGVHLSLECLTVPSVILLCSLSLVLKLLQDFWSSVCLTVAYLQIFLSVLAGSLSSGKKKLKSIYSSEIFTPMTCIAAQYLKALNFDGCSFSKFFVVLLTYCRKTRCVR